MEKGGRHEQEPIRPVDCRAPATTRRYSRPPGSEGSYRLHRCSDFYTARGYLLAEHTPDAIIEAFDAVNPGAIYWLDPAGNVAPLVVFCPFADLRFYKTARDHGAFDFFTAATPLEEVNRELNNAITWQTCQAA